MKRTSHLCQCRIDKQFLLLQRLGGQTNYLDPFAPIFNNLNLLNEECYE